MKIVLASEAMECCAKAMEMAEEMPEFIPDEALIPQAEADTRAIYVAAAQIQAGYGISYATAETDADIAITPKIPIPDWLAKAGGYA